MFFVRGRDAGAWAGIAMVVGAPSVHGHGHRHGMLFLLPTLSPLRRDLALLLAPSNRYRPFAEPGAGLSARASLDGGDPRRMVGLPGLDVRQPRGTPDLDSRRSLARSSMIG